MSFSIKKKKWTCVICINLSLVLNELSIGISISKILARMPKDASPENKLLYENERR